mmetsp:Transcript_75831/g.214396  ORF Transcript_75831/g.214396 Transcript_75831/m.214396 type:complete len:380 (-) Transcript_75831:2-1141(-)
MSLPKISRRLSSETKPQPFPALKDFTCPVKTIPASPLFRKLPGGRNDSSIACGPFAPMLTLKDTRAPGWAGWPPRAPRIRKTSLSNICFVASQAMWPQPFSSLNDLMEPKKVWSLGGCLGLWNGICICICIGMCIGICIDMGTIIPGCWPRMTCTVAAAGPFVSILMEKRTWSPGLTLPPPTALLARNTSLPYICSVAWHAIMPQPFSALKDLTQPVKVVPFFAPMPAPALIIGPPQPAIRGNAPLPGPAPASLPPKPARAGACPPGPAPRIWTCAATGPLCSCTTSKDTCRPWLAMPPGSAFLSTKMSLPYSCAVSGHSMNPQPFSGLKDFIVPLYAIALSRCAPGSGRGAALPRRPAETGPRGSATGPRGGCPPPAA